MKFTEAIRQMAKENNTSLKRLAEKSGLKPQGINNIIGRKDCKVSMLMKMADAMDYDIVLKPRGNGRAVIKIDELEDVTDNRGGDFR